MYSYTYTPPPREEEEEVAWVGGRAKEGGRRREGGEGRSRREGMDTTFPVHHHFPTGDMQKKMHCKKIQIINY